MKRRQREREEEGREGVKNGPEYQVVIVGKLQS